MRSSEEAAPASAMSSGSQENDLQEIRTSIFIRGYYGRGELLTMAEIQKRLSCEEVKTVGKTMMKNIDTVGSDGFLQVPVKFPVLALQHVTSHEGAKKILALESFMGREHERTEFNDLSFWSADISSDDIKKARQQTYDTLRMKVKPEDMETFHEEVMKQFANSPAFKKSASCYGNFRFSFPLSLLLHRYKTQHCKGGEPELRILGTDIYKQEVAHFIVVHAPDATDFIDLPKVQYMSTSSNEEFVYWMDGTLYWRPESTSKTLHLMISGDSCKPRKPEEKKKPKIQRKTNVKRAQRKRYPLVTSCVWNHLVLAFHLPEKRKLEIPAQEMLKNLTPCHALQPFLKADPIPKHEAREVIRSFNKNIEKLSMKSRRPLTPYEATLRGSKRVYEMRAKQKKKGAMYGS